jgi:hypothetical protein
MRVLIVILSAAVALTFAGIASAQTPDKESAVQQGKLPDKGELNKPMGEVQPAPDAEHATKPKEMKMMGSVVSVDAVANTMVVKGKKADVTFSLDPAAKIMMAGKECKLADVAKNTPIVVRYRMDGKKMIATGVMEQKMMLKHGSVPGKADVKQTANPEAKPEAKPANK